MQCSDCTEKCRDSSSEESQEINVDVAPPRRQPTTRKPQDMDKYYTKKAFRRSGRARPPAADGAARNNTIMIMIVLFLDFMIILEIQLFHGIMSYWSDEINRFPNIPK